MNAVPASALKYPANWTARAKDECLCFADNEVSAALLIGKATAYAACEESDKVYVVHVNHAARNLGLVYHCACESCSSKK